MTTWQRATHLTKCGRCVNGWIPVGGALHVVQLPGVKRSLFRCEACAEEPAPPLPALERKAAAVVSGFTRVGQLVPKGLPFDWKAAQVGREVGEEG